MNTIDQFLLYCATYSYNKPREVPLNPRTVGRYRRGLNLVKKIVGHDLSSIDATDQYAFMEGIMQYQQGTRRVSTQIFQRYIAWGIKNGLFTCENLIRGREEDIIGEHTPPKYRDIAKKDVEAFFSKLKTPKFRLMFGLMYYGGLTIVELQAVSPAHIVEDGLFLFREQRKEACLVALPSPFMKELLAYVGNKQDGLIFDLPAEDFAARMRMTEYFKMAQLESGELVSISLRDLRITGIRHFYSIAQDLELTKRYAGIHPKKTGWLSSLVTANDKIAREIAKERRVYGKPT